MTDNERIAEIRERCDKATPGPWEQCDNTAFSEKLNVEPNIAFCQHSQDADFVAKARQDIPYLLDLLADKDREIEQLREVIAKWEKYTTFLAAHGMFEMSEPPEGGEKDG